MFGHISDAERNRMLTQDVPSAVWLAAIARRHSRRTFDHTPAENLALDAIEQVCARFRPYADARTVLVRRPESDIFKGIVGGYGKVTNAPHVLVFIGDARSHYADQHVGYVGQAAILEATSHDLETCWIGGFFDQKRASALVALEPGERILAVSPLGHGAATTSSTERSMKVLARSSSRESLDTIAPGDRSAWPQWAVAAVETARIAPSAVNRQPWRFRLDGESLVISVNSRRETPKVTRRLDCGIAMLHAELGALAYGVAGSWTDLADGLDVARFDPASVS